MKNLVRVVAAAMVFAVASIGLHENYHFVRFGHLAPFGLHADIIVRKLDFGIPGVSETYEAKLTNYGIFPVNVAACDFVDDAFSRGTSVGYAVERWDPGLQRWRTIVRLDTFESYFCRPYPLGISQAHLVVKRLWPGQSISTGDEATAARDAFNIGDKGRFVVHEGDSVFPTAAFTIDEHPASEGISLRVRH